MGIFSSLRSNTRKYLDESKEKKRAEELETEFYKNELRKQTERDLARETRERAVESLKQKARDTLNSDAPLGHKVKAINELYREDKPKKSIALQELSDRMKINRLRRDERLEKLELIKQVVKEEKIRKMYERADRMNKLNEKKEFNNLQNNVKLMLRNAKFKR